MTVLRAKCIAINSHVKKKKKKKTPQKKKTPWEILNKQPSDAAHGSIKTNTKPIPHPGGGETL